MRIYCDFDGTITQKDTTDQVLSRFAREDWLRLEDEWLSGRLTAAECMRGQVALIDADETDLNGLLDSLELRAGFIEFAQWCHDQRIPLTIVSDGVDYFIRRILQRYNLAHLPVFSNRLLQNEAGYALEQPFKRAGCASGSGVCKCDIVSAPPPAASIVFVGDGRSDFCASSRADILFARDKLATYAAERNQPFYPFDDFFDVLNVLKDSQVGYRAGAATI